MSRRYLAFDLEIAKDVPGNFDCWPKHRPLGISCAATLLDGDAKPMLWYGLGGDDQPAPRMLPAEVARLVDYLLEQVAAGATLLTWNGLGFDLDVLAEESDRLEDCRRLAGKHVDMMFDVVCRLGYPLALDKVAKAMGLRGKPDGMTGDLAPRLWAEGRYQEVLDYVAQDVVTTLELAHEAEKRGVVSWTARSGKPMRLPLGRGWKNVEEACKSPEPDVSWMSTPLRRSKFTGWLG